MSNKSKHTPGPWRISGRQLGTKLLIEHGGEGEFSPAIGSVYTDDGRLPQEANAKLIAAAPDLLEALKQVANYPTAHNMTGGGDAGHQSMANIARAAIAKATDTAPDYSEYCVTVSDDPSYYGVVTKQQADEIAVSIQKLIEGRFPGIEVKRTSNAGSSTATTGPNFDEVESIDYWISQNWTASL